MSIFTVAGYTIKRIFRDKPFLVYILVIPLVSTLILGTALGSNFEISNIDKIKVAFVNGNNTKDYHEFEDYLNAKEIKQLIDAKNIHSYPNALNLLKNSEVTGVIHIEKRAISSQKLKIEIVTNENSKFKESIIKNIVDSFIESSNTANAIIKINSIPSLKKYKENILEVPITASSKTPGAMDYYAVTMLIMGIITGSFYASYLVKEDYYENTYIRIKSSPIRSYENFIGKILGCITALCIQSVVLILFTRYIYKANWGQNILMILFVCFSLSILSTALGIMTSILAKHGGKASSILTLFLIISTFISGGFTPIQSYGTLFSTLRYLSPNYLAQTAIFNNIYTGSSSQTDFCIITIWAMSIIFFLISLLAGRGEIR